MVLFCRSHADIVVDDRDQPFTTNDEDWPDSELTQLVKRNWNSMKNFHRCHQVMDVLNVRLWDPEVDSYEPDAVTLLERAYKSAGRQCKINASVGCILKHKTNGQLRYFHASPNEGSLLELAVAVESSQSKKLPRRTTAVSNMYFSP